MIKEDGGEEEVDTDVEVEEDAIVTKRYL